MKHITTLLGFLLFLHQVLPAQNVGIGTTTPSTKFQVLTTDYKYGFTHTDGAVTLGTYIDPSGGWIGTQSNHPLYFFTHNSGQLMTLGTNGNFGIGTISPAYNLDISSAGNTQLNLTNTFVGGLHTALFSCYTNRLEIQPSDAFQISVGGIDQRNLCIANNGYVGIGTSTPTNKLQVGTYTNANYGGNQLALGFGTNVTVLNQYPSSFNLQSSTAMNIQSASNIYLMPSNGNGYVGINTNTPGYQLEIGGTNYVTDNNPEIAEFRTQGTTVGPYAYSGITAQELTVAMYVNGSIEADTYYARSDKRIKNIIGISNAANDLKTVNKIKITDYTMKDKMTYGNRIFKKVIAQELEEAYPQSVKQQTDFIPNTYQHVDSFTKKDGSYMLHFNTPHTISKNAKFLKVYSKKGDAKLQVISVPSTEDVEVKAEDLSGSLFVYGEQVNDFRSVDYEALTTLNISATQELSKLVKEQQAEIAALKKEMEEMKKRSAATNNLFQ